jgi:hypothetical protein
MAWQGVVMKFWPWFVLLVLIDSGVVVSGQDVPTQQSIEAELQQPFLMLRGMYDGDKLDFDAQGNLIGAADRLPFSLSALLVREVRLNDGALEIDGERAGLFIEHGGGEGQLDRVRAVAWSKHGGHLITISIARDQAHPDSLDAALAKVLSRGIDEGLVATVPSYWQVWVRHQLHPKLPHPALRAGVYGKDAATAGGRDMSGMQHPVLVYAPDAVLLPAAKQVGYQGRSGIGVIVDELGQTSNEWVEQPCGMGLDESAILSATRYRFRPATIHGKPVSVEIRMEVNFRQ